MAAPFVFPEDLSSGLESLNVLSLPTLGSLDYVELDRLAFLERTEALRLDGGVMHEDILAVLAGNESETFCVIEPLHCALFHLEWILLDTDLPLNTEVLRVER